jgi:hypothetical protein
MPLCKHCGSSKVQKRGKSKQGKIKIKCHECKRYSETIELQSKGSKNTYRSARILLLDIETLPGEFYAFDPKVEYLSPDKKIKDWSISCYAAKWLFEPEIMGEVVTRQEAFDRTEASILEGIWELMDEADIFVTQNGNNFDLRKIKTKFIKYKFPPPSKTLSVDTLQVARSEFGFTYNRLDELGQEFGIGKKIDMVFNDWKMCLTNDDSAEVYLRNMLAYCKRDVAPLLEDVYLHMLPWIPNHPNLGLYTEHDGDVCPKCESQNLKWGEKYPTPQGMWEGFRCMSCGAIGRGKGKEHKIKGVNLTN